MSLCIAHNNVQNGKHFQNPINNYFILTNIYYLADPVHLSVFKIYYIYVFLIFLGCLNNL